VAHGASSQSWARRPAVVARLARTLGSAMEAVRYASRFSAFRREPNSHDAAEPRKTSYLRHRDQNQNGTSLPRELVGRLLRESVSRNDLEPPHLLEPPRCVGCSPVRSVHWAAAVSAGALRRSLPRRRQESEARNGRQRGAGSSCSRPPEATRPWPACVARSLSAALPNPSLKRSANGRPPGPGLWHMVHHHSPGPGVLPPSPP
jgi:hypothetical protein